MSRTTDCSIRVRHLASFDRHLAAAAVYEGFLPTALPREAPPPSNDLATVAGGGGRRAVRASSGHRARPVTRPATRRPALAAIRTTGRQTGGPRRAQRHVLTTITSRIAV